VSDFQARFVRRFGCTVNVLTGREFDSIGSAADPGGSCASCGGCAQQFGDVGLADEGVVIENSVASGLQLRWTCPGCGNDVYEDTDLLCASARAAVSKADPLCYLCRRSTYLSTNHQESVS
jgi:hypothetical protein